MKTQRYLDMVNKARISLIHNYPIPEDDETKRKMAIAEVDNHVKSRKTYMREFGEIEDEDKEFNEIIEEIKLLNEAERDNFDVMVSNADIDDEFKGKGKNE